MEKKKASITLEQILADGWVKTKDFQFPFEKQLENRNPINNKAFDFVSVLLSKVDNGPTSAAPIVRSWSQRAYGDWLLPVEIPMSSVVGSEALEFATIYDIESWSGSKKTLDRIREPFDQFCRLVDDEFSMKWNGGSK